MSGSVLVVGSTNMDLIVRAGRLPVPGETVLGGEFVQARGGKGANQAVAAARSGAQVAILTAIGRDAFGRESLNGFTQEGIDTSSVQRRDLPTGVALITVNQEGENCIVVAPGANGSLDAATVEAAYPSAKPDVCVCQLETPLEGVQAALEHASRAGSLTILNPAPAKKPDPALLLKVDCLTPNESETETLTGIRPDSIDSATKAGAILREQGVGTAIITMGAKGAVLVDSQGVCHQPSPEVETIDTTAAGDTFTGSLAARVAQGDNLREALRYACCSGALAVTRMGAQPSIPCAAAVSSLEREFCRLDD
ncbi:MAG: ribokinase [Gemmatimonadetes bacterium]|jgi:ribokinase|nr:ribokinase [Gemmatimonadota bacterium]